MIQGLMDKVLKEFSERLKACVVHVANVNVHGNWTVVLLLYLNFKDVICCVFDVLEHAKITRMTSCNAVNFKPRKLIMYSFVKKVHHLGLV